MQTLDNITTLPLNQIAQIIMRDWPAGMKTGVPTPFGNMGESPAKPYIQAMLQMESIHESYGLDDGHMIVRYFLGNAASWRGETARTVKAELKRRLAA